MRNTLVMVWDHGKKLALLRSVSVCRIGYVSPSSGHLSQCLSSFILPKCFIPFGLARSASAHLEAKQQKASKECKGKLNQESK